MDVPAVILLRKNDAEYACIVDTVYTPSETSILILEINNHGVSFSHATNAGTGGMFYVSREQGVKLAKLILHNEQERERLNID